MARGRRVVSGLKSYIANGKINAKEIAMPYKDITYDNGFTERFYYDETPYEEAKRMARTNRVKSFPSANHGADLRSSTWKNQGSSTKSAE